MLHNNRRWIWCGRLVFLLILISLASYMVAIGPDKASKLGGAIGLLAALCALVAPYLLKMQPVPAATTVQSSGAGAVAVGGDNSQEISTTVSGIIPATAPPVVSTTAATGHGSVSVAGNNMARIHTRVIGLRDTGDMP
jgi:hypothetical protein